MMSAWVETLPVAIDAQRAVVDPDGSLFRAHELTGA